MTTTNHPPGRFWKRNLDKIGVGASIFAALCCLGFPALLSILSATELGFIVNDAILLPLLLVSLAAALSGIYLGMRHHHQPLALILGGVSAVAWVLVVLGIVANLVLAYAGIVGLAAASFLNVWLRACQTITFRFGAPVIYMATMAGLYFSLRRWPDGKDL
jgi:mercuric ion transport protein